MVGDCSNAWCKVYARKLKLAHCVACALCSACPEPSMWLSCLQLHCMAMP